MTELLFRDDAYLTACEARVIALHGEAVELEAPDSILHVMEPGNTAEVGRVEVARIRSEGRRNKRVTLVLP